MKQLIFIAALCAISAPAFAQNLNDTPAAPDRHSTRPPPAPKVPTTLAPLDQSLAALLNDGWMISAANGVWSWTLVKGKRWAFCGMDDGQMSELSAGRSIDATGRAAPGD
jgi:hypothetical protein